MLGIVDTAEVYEQIEIHVFVVVEEPADVFDFVPFQRYGKVAAEVGNLYYRGEDYP